MKDCFLRVRTPCDEYERLKAAADQAGLTLSEYVRNVLSRDAHSPADDQFAENVACRIIGFLSANLKLDGCTNLEPLLVECLLLIREIVAERNAQLLSRIAHRMNGLYPKRRIV